VPGTGLYDTKVIGQPARRATRETLRTRGKTCSTVEAEQPPPSTVTVTAAAPAPRLFENGTPWGHLSMLRSSRQASTTRIVRRRAPPVRRRSSLASRATATASIVTETASPLNEARNRRFGAPEWI